MKLALVDLDGMIYAAGAVVEDVYHVVDGLRFDYKSQANSYCEKHGLNKADIEKEVDAQPVSHALNVLKTTLLAAVKDAGCDVYEAFLSPTDKSNFRFDIEPEYKANRKNAHKPVHYKAMRDYAERHLDAKVVHGMEADDILSIRAHERGMDDVVIVSNDKDMQQLPTWHYDWKKKTAVHKVTQEQGWISFYTQLLVGDTVDNIKGCPGIGPAKARAALKGLTTDQEMLDACYNKYLESFDNDADEARKMMALNARLLHLLEKQP